MREFQYELFDNLTALHEDLKSRQYVHGGYHAFTISDPKPRNIHKATVRDRLLHHALHRALHYFFDTTFISDSFSCRRAKGTHKAIERFTQFARRASKNNTRTLWVLKCDIRKFFANIDHDVLSEVLHSYIPDAEVMRLLECIIGSFSTGAPNKGLPLGNLTSQLLVNIYMNEFDQFMKHQLKAKYYIRYADDFVVLSSDKARLHSMLRKMREFLLTKLHLTLHPNKVSITTIASGIDFLGWVHFLDHRVLRTTTKRRMLKRISKNPADNVIQSYLGLLRHGNTQKLQEVVQQLVDSRA